MASNDLKDEGLNESNLENAYKRDDLIKFKSKFDSFVNEMKSSNQKKWKMVDPVLRETSYPPGLHGVTVAENVSLEAPWGVLCGGEQWLFGVDNTTPPYSSGAWGFVGASIKALLGSTGTIAAKPLFQGNASRDESP
ncbi:hypothetical protein NC652_013172 [Populus alba x Populus x berolinensis]|nr:hypothetical protein NC652_013172 [Populus alba x Populus x berolinensis]